VLYKNSNCRYFKKLEFSTRGIKKHLYRYTKQLVYLLKDYVRGKVIGLRIEMYGIKYYKHREMAMQISAANE